MESTVVQVNLSAIHDYTGILILLSIILFLTLLWKLWKTGKAYANLPSCYILPFEIVYEYLTNKTKPLPFTAVFFQKLDNTTKRFEKEGLVHVWFLRHILIIVGEEVVKVFATAEASADKAPEYQMIEEAFGEGLVTSNGETWKKDRKILNPVFHIGNLKAQIPIFNENAKILIGNLANLVDKPVADLLPFLEHCVYHNICESLFDVNMKDKVSEMEIEHYFDLMTKLEKYITSRWFFPPLIGKLHRFCTPSGWKNMKMYKELKQFCWKVIYSAMESISQKSSDSNKDLDRSPKSISHTLLQYKLKDPSVPQSYLEDHVCTFLSAGIDTVNYTIMWCLYLLGLHKDVQKEAYDEIQSVSEDFITYENICQLEYMECIIKETMRLYPTVPILARHLKKDLQCGKHTVPKNTTIVFSLYRLHRNPERYPDPEKFDPDRFRSTNAENRNWAHLPFSEGYRTCIGKKFAVMEMKVILAYFLRNYEITSLDRREDVDLNWNFVLLPIKRLRMRITRRQIMPKVSL